MIATSFTALALILALQGTETVAPTDPVVADSSVDVADPAPSTPAAATSTATTTATTATTATTTSQATATAALPQPREGVPVVVLDLRAEGVDASLASAVSAVAAASFADLGVLRVTTEEDVRRLMDYEQLKLILACEDEASCLRDFQETLGAELMVTGTVGKSGSDTVVGLVLTDLAKGTPIAREVAVVKTPSTLTTELRQASGRLFRSVLRQRAGTLVVMANVDGATVLLDGAAVGVTPLRLTNVPAGPHRVEATSDGFHKGSIDVTVPPKDQIATSVLLSPSAELAASHARNNWMLRIGAAGAGVLALTSIGTGAAVWATQYDLMQNPETGYASQYSQADGGAVVLPESKFNEVNGLRVTSYALMGAAVPLAITGVVLFALSDDPNRYGEIADNGGEDGEGGPVAASR